MAVIGTELGDAVVAVIGTGLGDAVVAAELVALGAVMGRTGG